MRIFFKNKFFLWLVLFIPSFAILFNFLSSFNERETYEEIMHSTGEFSVRLLVLTLYISPLLIFFKKSKVLAWLRKNRRYIGVAAFFYSLLHFIAYLLFENFATIIDDLTQIRYLSGWVGLIILGLLALTSFDQMVKKLGAKKWKKLHRTIYLAALLIAIHWLLLEDNDGELNFAPVLIHFGPLLILQLYCFYLSKKKLRSN